MLLTPESSVAVQKQLGADIIIPLDELPGYHTAADELRRSLQRSHRWMARSLAAHRADVRQQAMYAVVHGGTDLELRAASAEHLRQFPYDGWAVGGSLGRDREDLARVLGHTLPLLPRDRPVHLLGIGGARARTATAERPRAQTRRRSAARRLAVDRAVRAYGRGHV